MRICFVSREVAGLRGGGIGTYVAEAAKALTARGHEVWLLTDSPGDGLRLPGFFRIVAVTAQDASRPPFLFAATHYEYAFRVHETLQSLGVSFDYIEFADYQAEGLVAIREQEFLQTYGETVLAVTLHSPSYECYECNAQLHRATQHEWETFALEDAMLRDAMHWNAPSQALRDRVAHRLGRDPGDVAIVRYPMAFDRPAPGLTAPASLGATEFVFFGRIEPRKGVEPLVEAFARMPELRLRLIGGDTPFSPYGGSFVEWIERSLPSNVRIEPALPRAELLQVLASAHVCLLPSRFENWPNACLEAMGLGRVVVGGRDGGMAEMIEDGVSGFLVDGNDAGDIVRVVSSLAARLADFPAIGRAAAARAREIAAPDAYCDVIEASVSARRGATPARPSAGGKVSIVIPFYRDRDTIDAAVRSAVAQTHPDVEVLVVNDGSPLDDAAAILARVAALDPRIRVLEKSNGGLSSARNHGIDAATGEFLLFLDADNELRPEYAARCVQALRARPDAGFAVPHVRFFDERTGADVGVYNPLPFVRGFALMINRFGDAGAFFRRSVFEAGLRYDELLISFEDWALWMDLDRAGVRGVAVPRVLYDYRMRADSMMQEDAWPNFRALVGLLIERHFPTDAADHEVLWMLNQTWGRDASAWERAREEKGRWPFRYVFVDKLYGVCRRVPGLRALVDAIGNRLRRLVAR